MVRETERVSLWVAILPLRTMSSPAANRGRDEFSFCV